MTCGMPSPRESQTKTSSAARRRGTSGAVAEEAEGAVEAEGGGERAELGGVLGHEGVGPADDEEAGGGLGGVDEGGGAEEVLDALLAVEAADPADQRRVAGDAEGGADRGAGGGVELGRGRPSRGSRRRGAGGRACGAAAASRMLAQTPT